MARLLPAPLGPAPPPHGGGAVALEEEQQEQSTDSMTAAASPLVLLDHTASDDEGKSKMCFLMNCISAVSSYSSDQWSSSRPSVAEAAENSRAGSLAEASPPTAVDRRRRDPFPSIMSEMNDCNAAALVENPEPMDEGEDNSMPSAKQQEEAIKKKFGGLMPKKPPLISKDHECAYFDFADWALGKQGVAKPKGPLEALRPKLQPTRQQQQQRSKRSIYTASENEDGEGAGAEDMSVNRRCLLIS